MQACFHRSERERDRLREKEREMRVHATREYFSQGFPDLVFPDATLSPPLSLSLCTPHTLITGQREREREREGDR